MSRKVVRLGVFLLVLPLATVAIRGYGDEPRPKPAVGGDDPFGGGDGGAKPSAAKKPTAKEPSPKPAQSTKPAPAANAKPKPKSPPKLHGGEKAILKALKQQTSIDFQETPLKDVVEYLSDTHHIPIVLDAAGLKDAGVDPESPVTKHLSGISLQSALQIMLDELQLKWAIHNEVLMITSPQKAESDDFMETKIYDVADLVLPIPTPTHGNPLADASGVVSDPMASIVEQSPGIGPWFGPPAPMFRRTRLACAAPSPANGGDFAPLKDMITNTVSTKSWIDNGGNGTISDSPFNLSLVVSQTREVHGQIEQLLADLRARMQANPVFRVELHWLWLDAAHRDRLFGSEKDRATGHDSHAVNLKRLSRIESESSSFHAVATFINGQETTVAAGDRRAIIVNAVPRAHEGTAYCPIVAMPNVGVTAHLTAWMQPGSRSAMITVQSVVTRWTPKRGPVTVGASWGPGSHVEADASQSPASPSGPVIGGLGGGFMQVAAENVKTEPVGTPAAVGNAPTPNQPPTANSQASTSPSLHTAVSSHGGSTSCPIDLPVMPTQEFGTTLRVPLGKPVVVGSVTFAPAGDAGVGEAKVDAVEVYLIATTSVVKNEATARPREAKP